MIYKTYGLNCEKFRFKKIEKSGSQCIWQRVEKFLCFWIPKGEPFRDVESMFYPSTKKEINE